MNTYKKNKNIFLVLVPHRDVRLEAKKYSSALLTSGLKGVYCFPQAAPVASLSHPLKDEELKAVARSLRYALGKNKINSFCAAVANFPEENNIITQVNKNIKYVLYGPRLEFDIPPDVFDIIRSKTISLISPIVIGSFLIPDSNIPNLKNNIDCLSPKLSFRAAAAANMYWHPFKIDNDTGYKWKIGKLSWLPRPAKK